MKYFVAIALIATVASAAFIKPTAVSGELAEIQEIIAAINSPSTNPATAAALQDMLFEVLGVNPEPIAVGPAIVETVVEPISVGPAIVDFPVLETPIIAPSPVVIAPGPDADVTAASAPLVQIILNINQAVAESAPVAPAPVVAPEADKPEPIHVVESAPEVIETAPIAVNPIGVVEIAPEPVHVVEVAPEPVHVVEVAPEPVHVVEVAPVEAVPIQVIETAPVAVEPVIIGTPILPAPAVVLPETLN